MTWFAELRALLAKAPSRDVWESLLALFLNCPAGDERDAGVLYARGHLKGWPSWLRSFSSVAPHHPAWELAQAVTLKEADCRHWRRLKNYPNISCLTLEAPLSLRDIEGLEDLETLKGLRLKRCVWLEDSKRLSGLENLQDLFLQGCDQVREVAGLTTLRALKRLEVSEAPQLEAIEPLQQLVLKSLSLRGNLSLERLGPLQGMQSLQSLDVGSCANLSSQALDVLSTLPSLRHVVLYDLPSLSALPTMPALLSLDLSFCAALKSLQGLEQSVSLRDLILTGCLSLRELSPLEGLKQLERLDGSRCLALEDVSALANLPLLSNLNLRVGKGKLTYAEALPRLKPKPLVAWMEVRGMVEPYQKQIAKLQTSFQGETRAKTRSQHA